MYPSSCVAVSKKQQGVSLPNLLVWSGAIVILAIFGMRLIPSYIEFNAVKQTLITLANSPELRDASPREIRMAFDKRAAIHNIESVNGSDVIVDKQGERLSLSTSYTVSKPLFANFSLLIDFDATSD